MAQAIEREGQAKAEAIRMIKDAGADEAVLTMKSPPIRMKSILVRGTACCSARTA